MNDDFRPPSGRKPKVIQPLTTPASTPLPELVDTAASTELIETSAAQTGAYAAGTASDALPANNVSKLRSWQQRLQLSWPPTRFQIVIVASIGICLVAGGLTAWHFLHHTPPVRTAVSKPKAIIKPKVVVPTTVASTLSGLQVTPDVNQRPVTGVMIENSPDARPQSGLDQASVVFEAIAEGGITRFLALYQDTQPDYLGPVRSARPYYVQWCMSFDCSLAHVGGSPEALADIPAWGTKNLDQFANAGAFERISSRYAPHNVYTSMAQLNQLETSRGYGASSFTSFARKVDAPYKGSAVTPASPTAKKTTSDSRSPASSIDMAISSYYYNTHYDYDAATNSYKRSEGGAPHVSLHKDGSQVQITPKAVIVMVMQYGLEADDHHSQYNVIGSGQAFIFQDGTVSAGSWSKADLKTPLSFSDAAGKPIALNAGQTWLTALSAANQVTYK